MKPTDQTLLQQFIRTRSGTAFDQLVRRHAPLVHGSILRKVRNPALAEDATQAVFLVLAQKASTLADRPALGGWLLKTARYAATDALRKETRHARHEKIASQGRREAVPPAAPTDEAQLEALDDALAALASADREALLLRYYQEESFADIGIALGTTEEGARKRTTRALAKLRSLLNRRGTAVTLAALGMLLADSAKSASAAAAGVAFISPMNIFAATSRGASISKGVTHMFATAKLKLLAAVAATSVTCATTGLVIYTAVHAPAASEGVASENLAIADNTQADAATPVASSISSTGTGTVFISNNDGPTQPIPITRIEGTLSSDPTAKTATGEIKTVVFLLNSNAPVPATSTETYESAVTGQEPVEMTGITSLSLISQGVILETPDGAVTADAISLNGLKATGVVVNGADGKVPQPASASGKLVGKMTIISNPGQPASLTIKNDAGHSTTLSLPNGSTISTQKTSDLP